MPSPGQAAPRYGEHGQAQQAAQRAHGVHLPGQGYVQGSFTNAGPVGGVDGTHQEQAADAPRQQRPDYGGGYYNQTFAPRPASR